ncbi:MAG: class I SAM-dependent methyltransferase [Candidatus Aenigmatarchaeota archaeon]
MKENIKQYYRVSDPFSRYSISNKDRVDKIKKLYNSNKKYFGKRVLDICCGGGVLGFIIEPKGHKYTGMDIDPDMINSAKRHVRKINSDNKIILGDATKKKLSGKFDTLTNIGNSLIHINLGSFLKIMKNFEKNIHRGTYFVIEYRDVVRLFYDRQWKNRMVEKSKGKVIISLTKGANMEVGEAYKEASERSGKNKVEFIHAIWSPFILENIMKLFGWKLVKRKSSNVLYTDVYRKE